MRKSPQGKPGVAGFAAGDLIYGSLFSESVLNQGNGFRGQHAAEGKAFQRKCKPGSPDYFSYKHIIASSGKTGY